MTLRKCPACRNEIDVENEMCPICGCNPRLRRVRSFVMWGGAFAVFAWVLLHGHVHWL